ncbi:MAG: branched-chain amino acid ABC transporter permease [Chloroflexota bacterium]|nr:branched-chain amino acid ABC transporter permease [Chloroflexota bacterium]
MSARTSRIDLSEIGNRPRDLLAIVLAAAVVGYICWAISQSPQQALQFTFNGLSVGAIYALLAVGFTLVYSTVWFFDLYYGAAAAIGAYGIFYLRSGEALGGQYQVNDPTVNVVFALVTAGVAFWALRELYGRRLRDRFGRRSALGLEAFVGGVLGAYMGVVLAWPGDLNVIFAPAIGLTTLAAVAWLVRAAAGKLTMRTDRSGFAVASVIVGAAMGVVVGVALANAGGSRLYLSWVVACLLAGMVGLAFYRGLYVQIIRRTNSRLIMLVASLGVLLALTALTIIVFESAPRPLPEAFGSAPWQVGGATIKGFNVFAIGVAIAAFVALLLLLKRTSFGKSVRAIGDDEEVAKVVGINTTVVIAIVFFIGAVFAALAGVLNGHDTAIQPRMGLIMLLKGWIASVVGGIGNLYGAIVGGFALGLIEQFGIWNLAGEWKDVVSFVVLILFLSFWPNGLLPRR